MRSLRPFLHGAAEVSVPTTVPSFDTISTGFCLGQLALAELPQDARVIVFSNTAPRRDLKKARAHNEGEGLVFARLTNGAEILAVNSGYSLSFVRENIRALFAVNVDQRGTQFRSRDIYPKVIAALVREENSFMGQELNAAQFIPDIPKGVVGYVDSFHNLKTTFRTDDPEIAQFQDGQRVFIGIKGAFREAHVASGSFNVEEGEWAFAPGSSGFTRRFWEIFLRGGHAGIAFGGVNAGDKIEIITV
jgi:hypothetical protein